jgi:hypothetical protein
VKIVASFNSDENEHCPLGYFCLNLVKRADELPNAEDMVKCLLEVDKSEEVVGDAVFGCLDGYKKAVAGDGATVDRRNGRLYGMVEMLLKANPEVAKYRGPIAGHNILHWACWSSLPSKLYIDIMKLVLALHKDAVQEADGEGRLPVHCAAGQCDVEVVEFLLGLYPEAANEVTSDGQNLLDWAALSNTSAALLKVQYLCSRYPAMIQRRDDGGMMPVHRTINYGNRIALVLCEAGGIEQFKTPIAHPTDANYLLNGYLPLHLFVGDPFNNRKFTSPATSEAADMLRWLLRLYPEAAGIEGGVGAGFKKTPYQLAIIQRLPDYYLRLLLRAAPTLNPAELHRLNFAERRMAMFLAFKAVTARLQKPFLLARLRGVNKDLVQRVVSFL